MNIIEKPGDRNYKISFKKQPEYPKNIKQTSSVKKVDCQTGEYQRACMDIMKSLDTLKLLICEDKLILEALLKDFSQSSGIVRILFYGKKLVRKGMVDIFKLVSIDSV